MDKELLDGENVFVIHGFLSYEDCDRLIARSEALGYEAATVGDVLVTEFRNNARVILDDPDLAAELWARARPFVPQVGGWEAVGVLAKDATGRLAMTRVALKPRVRFSGEKVPGPEELRQLHDLAHHACFIANSVKTEVVVEPQ